MGRETYACPALGVAVTDGIRRALRTDPFERADITSNSYYDWFLYHPYIIFAAQSIVVSFLETFKDYPPRQKAASFTIDQAMAKMSDAASGAGR